MGEAPQLLRLSGCDGHPGNEVDVGAGDRADRVGSSRGLESEEVAEAPGLFEALPGSVKPQGRSERLGAPGRGGVRRERATVAGAGSGARPEIGDAAGESRVPESGTATRKT